jgi:hypothetical protein
MAVWEDHLLPLLTCEEAARLGCTCKALERMVREHFKDLGCIDAEHLRAALTTFPAAREVALLGFNEWGDGEKEALLQWLRDGGRGRHLESIEMDNIFSSDTDLVHEALQQGVLSSLRRVQANLQNKTHRASLMNGFVGGVHDLFLAVDFRRLMYIQVEPQLAALCTVRQLPALAMLEVYVRGEDDDAMQWPPFIPPSLRALRIDVQQPHGPPITEPPPGSPLLRDLPDILGASGAKLDRLEVLMPTEEFEFRTVDNALGHVAKALRCCVPILKGFFLSAGHYGACYRHEETEEEFVLRAERLRARLADMFANLSACPELEVLVLPAMTIEPLFPLGAVFARLTHLQLSDHEREFPHDAGVVGMWELMA